MLEVQRHHGADPSTSDERLRTLARLVRGYVFEARFTANGAIEFTWADDAFMDLFGCERIEINRLGWHNFVDQRDRAAVAKRLSAVAAGTSAEVELRVVDIHGEQRWLRMAAEPVKESPHGAVIGMIGMAEDITERKDLMEQMFESVNREQRRIGSDLHDELGQVLTGASLLLRACHSNAIRGIRVTPEEIDSVLGLLTGAIESTRLLAHGLAPGTLGSGGFASALESLANQARRWSGLKIELLLKAQHLDSLPTSVADHLYRIVQEAITNVARHADAKHVAIETCDELNVLALKVTDDGKGNSAKNAKGFGLRTMQYRADAIGAEFSIEDVQPHGSQICVRLTRVRDGFQSFSNSHS